MGCIFCEIVSGQQPSHKIWEDDKYLAFLSIFPNTEGFSVVIPKKHLSSYLFDQPE
ncbi:HIT family protein, partial [Limnobacter sp.]